MTIREKAKLLFHFWFLHEIVGIAFFLTHLLETFFPFLYVEMPRLFTLFTGLALATAVSYKYKDSFLKGQDDLQRSLDNVKSTLDKAPAVTRNYMSDSQKYVSDRLMPSGKRKKHCCCCNH